MDGTLRSREEIVQWSIESLSLDPWHPMWTRAFSWHHSSLERNVHFQKPTTDGQKLLLFVLKQHLGFSYLVLSLLYLVVCVLFVLSQRLQMRSSGFPVTQVCWALAAVLSARPQQPLALSSWCRTAAAPSSKVIKARSPSQSRECWQCTNTATETWTALWAVPSSPSGPIPGGFSRLSVRLAMGGCFPAPGEET